MDNHLGWEMSAVLKYDTVSTPLHNEMYCQSNMALPAEGLVLSLHHCLPFFVYYINGEH